jgi:hypothetical protein
MVVAHKIATAEFLQELTLIDPLKVLPPFITKYDILVFNILDIAIL